eukprot:9456606-Alexandrium_andersonii.AAC.1
MLWSPLGRSVSSCFGRSGRDALISSGVPGRRRWSGLTGVPAGSVVRMLARGWPRRGTPPFG